jgi:hypothetical protein
VKPAAEMFPQEISPAKVKIKKKKVYKKMEKPIELKIKEPESMSKKGLNWLKVVIVAFILGCLLGLSGTAVYFYRQYKKAVLIQNISPGGEDQTAKELQSIKEAIGRFMELPGNEEPVLATVTDIEKIKTQPFFANAQNGDKVLIYADNKKAILYRPLTGKIVEVSTISGEGNNIAADPLAESPTQNNETTPEVLVENNSTNVENIARVAVYNGGKINGLAQRIGDKIALIAGVTVSEKTNAKGSYEKNLVIDLSGNRGELAQKIAEMLGGEVGMLPEGETKPEADILVIASKE